MTTRGTVRCLPLLCGLSLITLSLWSQETVSIRVNAGESSGSVEPVWRFFGYDEPNYTYTDSGRELISKLADLSDIPVYLRTHNLLTSGDGAPALKWGSTNAYTEDASGNPVYDWTIVDRILDTYLKAGARPFVEIGFMPKALSVRPDPYQHRWPKGTLWTGWSYPPKDYGKWAELVYRLVLHSIERYGRAEVENWYWEAWNEPDIGYWQGTPQEYLKLYDYTADAVKRALPTARVGGPASTGPANAHAGTFLRSFLEHCDHAASLATGRAGVPLDFISFHAKGSTRIVNGQAEMKVGQQLADLAQGFEIVEGFEKFRDLPIVVSESDPEGCAACVANLYPQNAYRNTAQYAAYEAEVVKAAGELARRSKVHLAGLLTWAFEFEDQPYFAGYRTLSTHDIDKPVLNIFRMLGLSPGEEVRVESTGAQPLDTLLGLQAEIRQDIAALATRRARQVSVLLWNYSDLSEQEKPTPIDLNVAGLTISSSRALVHHYRIDETHSNAFSLWQALGSPQNLASDQYSRIKAAGHLQLLESPKWMASEGGQIALRFELPRNSVSLVQVAW